MALFKRPQGVHRGTPPQAPKSRPRPANADELAETVDDLEAQRDAALAAGKHTAAIELDRQARAVLKQLDPGWPGR